jgi:hypothetical protein
MSISREKAKNRRIRGRFFALPNHVLDSVAYSSLNGWTVKLIVDLGKQYNGRNNGDLCATFSIMKKYGWNSKGTLSRALKSAQKLGFIELTRQGGRHKPSLFALTWHPIDECKGKLDVNETAVPSNLWKKIKMPAPNEGQSGLAKG